MSILTCAKRLSWALRNNPLTEDNAVDGKIGSDGSMVIGWMEH